MAEQPDLFEITISGPPALYRALQQMLAEDGIAVARPNNDIEERSVLAVMAVSAGSGIIARGGYDAISAVVARFRGRFKDVEVDVRRQEGRHRK